MGATYGEWRRADARARRLAKALRDVLTFYANNHQPQSWESEEAQLAYLRAEETVTRQARRALIGD